MCLYTDSKQSSIAEEDITVYKMLIKLDSNKYFNTKKDKTLLPDIYASPFTYTKYYHGINKPGRELNEDGTWDESKSFHESALGKVISSGWLHAYRFKEDAINEISEYVKHIGRNLFKNIILEVVCVKMTIPKGSHYVYGFYNRNKNICSDTLVWNENEKPIYVEQIVYRGDDCLID